MYTFGQFYHLASSFATAFEEAFAALKRMQDSKSDKNRVPTMQERMQLSHDIFKLDSIELAAVLTMIEKSCPSALSRRPSHDEVLVNVDALKPSVFHEVNGFIMEALLTHISGPKKRKNEVNVESVAPAVVTKEKSTTKKAK